MSAILGKMNFWAGICVFATTIACIMLFEWYRSKNPPPEGVDKEHMDFWWYVGLWGGEAAMQVYLEPYLEMGEAVTSFIADVIGNTVVFFICYGVMSVLGVSKDNADERLGRAFKFFVILTWGLCLIVFE